MSTFEINAILGVLGLAIFAALFLSMLEDRNHYRKLYRNDEAVIVKLNDKIESMTTTQDRQTVTTKETVTKVVQGPATVRTIIKHVDVPIPADCSVPVYPQDVKDAF